MSMEGIFFKFYFQIYLVEIAMILFQQILYFLILFFFSLIREMNRNPLSLSRATSIASSETVTLVPETEENAKEQNLILKHLRALTKGTSYKYQKQVVVINCLIWIQITLVSMVGSYLFMNPIFECKGTQTKEAEACRILSKCKILNQATATYANGLYCEKEDERVMIQSLFPIGCLIGMFLLPWAADQFGRKKALLQGVTCLIIGTTSLYLGLQNKIYFLIFLGQILNGIFASGCSILTSVISSEVTIGFVKQSSIMIYNSVWGASLMSFYLIDRYVESWETFLIYLVLIPSVGIWIAAYSLMMETPNYLYMKQKSKSKYLQMMKKMAKTNRSQPHRCHKVFDKRGKYHKFDLNPKEQSQKGQEGKKFIWNNPQVLKVIACISIGMTGYNIFYFGIQGSMESTGNSYGVSMLLAGLHELIGFSLCGILITKIPRKRGLILTNAIGSILGLLLIFIMPLKIQFLQSIIFSINTLATVFGFSLISTLMTESFSSSVKSTAMGITTGLSQIGRIAVPMIINFSNKANFNPLLIFSISLLTLGIIPILFMDETLEEEDDSEDENQEVDECTQIEEEDDFETRSERDSTQMKENWLKRSFSQRKNHDAKEHFD